MNNLLRCSKVFIKRNASTILTCAGGAGVVATAVMAVKATPKATALLEQAKKEKGEELTKLEVVRVAGPAYIPAVAVGVSTLACIFGANRLNKRQQAALMSAYALLDSSYKDYKHKVEELYGEEAHDRVVAEVAKDKYQEVDIPEEDGKELFYDLFSERYFRATMADVIKAEYEVNRRISLHGSVHLNEFYELLDIPAVDYGEYLGWSSSLLMDITWADWLEFNHEKTEFEDGLECYLLSTGLEPMFDFEYY